MKGMIRRNCGEGGAVKIIIPFVRGELKPAGEGRRHARKNAGGTTLEGIKKPQHSLG